MKNLLRKMFYSLFGGMGVFYALKLVHAGLRRRCIICDSQVRRFLDQGYNFRVLWELQVVGGIPRRSDECPVCRANDRTRLVILYLSSSTGFLEDQEKVLHIAPERSIMFLGRKSSQEGYICGDINPARYPAMRPITKLDITALPFEEASFSLVICNHVIEHVPNDDLALREIWRVLQPGGQAILQVPIAMRLRDTREDNSIIEPSEREVFYGQKDHVRLYSRSDYVGRLSAAGFSVQEFDAYEHDPKLAFDYDVNPFEILFIAAKSC